jgi:hypothetical protein
MEHMKYGLLLILVNALINIFVQMKQLCTNFTYFNIMFTSIMIIVISTYLLNGSFEIPSDNNIDQNMAYLYPFILSLMLILLYVIITNFQKYKKVLITLIFYTSITTSLCFLFNTHKTLVVVLLLLWVFFDQSTPEQCPSIKFYINNIIAILVSIASIVSININNFKTGLILLTGLFIFDIFWVFGSKYFADESVMVKVATNIDAPIIIRYANNDTERGEIIIGLGDIILPALFLKMLLTVCNYDCNNIYYIVSTCFYLVGLTGALTASIVFKQGQPALLYIVPSIIIPVITLALARNEFNMLLNS